MNKEKAKNENIQKEKTSPEIEEFIDRFANLLIDQAIEMNNKKMVENGGKLEVL